MQKSTPLSQLPSMHISSTHTPQQNSSTQISPPSFVNEQQRQIVTQAQHASQTFALPQNTQQSNDIMNEDSTTIQDALDALGATSQTMVASSAQPPDMDEYMVPAPPAYNPDVAELFMQQQQASMASLAQTGGGQGGSSSEGVDMKSKLINDILSWNDELKLALFGTALFVLLYSFPIENYIYKYISLDKIPNSNMLIKAAVMFIGILVIAKFT